LEGIKRKVNHDVQDGYGNTAFHYSSRNAELDMMSDLISAKAQRVANKFHLYPIHMAIESQNMQAVHLLKGTF